MLCTGRFGQLSIIYHMVGFAVCRHPAQRFFETRRNALDKPGANDAIRAALEQGLTGVLTVDAGLFRALTTDHCWINNRFTGHAAVIDRSL
ncbi:hypothetical protein D3C76_1665280 [compost metagenome]